ncbi:MAG: nucleotidyl transferase AbiEii/AbiGii toxin family protein [Thermoanaerobaculia bacterium]
MHYAVFGGAALNLHGLARFTDDLDLFIDPTIENVERLKRALAAVFDDDSISEISADDLLGDYPAVQYIPPEGTFHVDILTRLGDAFRFPDLEIVRIPLDELTVSVVSPRTLYEMKKGTTRLQDRADAELLRERFSLEED